MFPGARNIAIHMQGNAILLGCHPSYNIKKGNLISKFALSVTKIATHFIFKCVSSTVIFVSSLSTFKMLICHFLNDAIIALLFSIIISKCAFACIVLKHVFYDSN